ncbi:hypothetical protein ACQP2E_20125 [Actinoplanes sp. CA-015351]
MSRLIPSSTTGLPDTGLPDTGLPDTGLHVFWARFGLRASEVRGS